MKKKKRRQEESERYNIPKKFNFKLLLILLFNTVIIFTIYRVGVYFEFKPMLWIYFGATLALSLGYIIYNRGLSRRNITHDMLPESWSAVQKQQFLDEDKKWKDKSKWMLTLLFPFIITFMFEVIDLFFIDYIKNIFPSFFK